MLVYATPTDLAMWAGDPAPINASQLLRSASILVRDATRAALYDVDQAGKPSDSDVLTAFKDATCAQAAMWAAAGIDPTEGGVAIGEPTVASKSMGGRSISYTDLSSSVTVQQDRAKAARELCAEAVAILEAAGLTSGMPAVRYG